MKTALKWIGDALSQKDIALQKHRARKAKWARDNREKIKAYETQYHLAHPEKRRLRMARWHAANREKVRLLHLEHRLKAYGLTIATKLVMAKKQKHRCLLCGKKKLLVVDHCHKNGEVRGLLCSPCNTSLGHYEKIKAQAEKYLARFKKGQSS